MKRYRIWSFEHNAWWKPDWNGYTENIKEAGIYTEENAKDICDSANLFKINEEMRLIENEE